MYKGYVEYDPEVLARLQQTELEILKDFDALCTKYGIEYFGMGGTAIGAVRHGGMIPWDDDIDVGLTREDYEKFLSVAATEYPDKYYILSAETEPNYFVMNTHWCMKGTEFRTEDVKDSPCNFGIFLDVFCFDNVPDDEKLMKKQAFRAWLWGKLLVMRYVSHPTLYFYGWKRKVISAICFLGHWTLKILHIPKSFFYKKAKKYSTMYNDRQTKRIAFMFEPKRYISMLDRDEVFPTQRLSFDGLNICFPGKVDALLTKRYGDYMTPPPEDKRHNHPPYILSFGPEDEE